MSSVTVQEVVAKFTADDSDLQKVAARAVATMGKFAVAGAGAATAALGILTKKSMEAADRMAKLTDSLGLNHKQFQAMALYGEEAGVSIEKLTSSMTILQRQIVDAAQGGEATSAALDSIGLSAKDLLSLTPDQQFMKVAEALNSIQNSSIRTATAMDLFGRGGREVINMLGGITAGTAEALAFQEKFNLNLSRVDAAKIEEANDAMGRVWMSLDGIGNTIATETSPLLTALSNQFLEAAPTGKQFGESVSTGMKIAAVSIDVLRAGVLGIIMFLKEAMYGLTQIFAQFERGMNRIKNDEFLKKVLDKVGVKMSAPSNDAQLWAEEWKASVDKTVGDLKNMKTTIDMIDEAQAQATKRAEGKVAGMKTNPSDFYLKTKQDSDAAKNAIKEHEDAVKKLQEQYDALGKQASDTFYDMLTGAQSFGDGIRGVLNNILKSIYDATIGKSISNNISNILSSSGILGGVGSSSGGGLFSGLFNSIGSSLGSIFKFADGGVVSGPTVFPIGTNTGMAGEAGAEAIMPLTRKGGVLGVANHGGSGATVNQTINISTGVQQTVRAEILRLMPQISAQSVRAVQDANRRNMVKL